MRYLEREAVRHYDAARRGEAGERDESDAEGLEFEAGSRAAVFDRGERGELLCHVMPFHSRARRVRLMSRP